MKQTDEQLWREARERLLALDTVWPDAPVRRRSLEACRAWLAARHEQPRLSALARLLTPDMTRAQFWCALVPVEREVARIRVTDIEILDRDLTPESEPAAPLMPLTVVTDSLRSAFNVGGIFRTAECFGVAEVVLCGYTPAPDRPQTARAALGAEKLVRWRDGGNVRAALAGLKANGVRCVALETVADAKPLERAEWAFPCALVLGNERFGLDADVIKLCDEVVRIPLCGRKNSLNVVSAFTIAAYTARQWFDMKSKTG
mgnify:CR=1 FL=1